jgi:hypothetical protein
VYSVQQIKFECLAYIKEYGGDPAAWVVLASEAPTAASFARWDVDQARDIWMCKPALSLKAALNVVGFLRDRMGVAAPSRDVATPDARFVLLYRKQARPEPPPLAPAGA